MHQDVRLIARIGLHGQIGLGGVLPPWGPDADDLAEFTHSTAGGVLVMGWATIQHLNGQQLTRGGRGLAVVTRVGMAVFGGTHQPQERVGDRNSDFLHHPQAALDHLVARFPNRTLWICGGERVFTAFAPYCSRFQISRADYDGRADTYLPVLPWMVAPDRAFLSA